MGDAAGSGGAAAPGSGAGASEHTAGNSSRSEGDRVAESGPEPVRVVPAPPPGIDNSVDFATYQQIDAISSGDLRAVQRSALHLWQQLHGEEDRKTRPMDLGTAVHMLALEPDRFRSHYVVAEQCEADKKNGERCQNPGLYRFDEYAWFCGVHRKQLPDNLAPDDITILEAELHEHTIRTVDAILQHPAVDIENAARERAFFWRVVTQSGEHMAKGLADIWHERDLAISDIKTSSSARRQAFQRTIGSRGYHIQAGHYALGHQEVTGEALHEWRWIVAEPYPPYAVAVYVLDPLDLAGSVMLVRQLYERYARVVDEARWEPYNQAPEPILLPGWALEDLEDDEPDYAELF